MIDYSEEAISAAQNAQLVYCKFLSANDTGITGAHQAGIYVSKPAVPILFDEYGIRGENKDKWVKIKWQNDFETDTRFIYYGRGSRNEYRITNFGRGFPFLQSEFTGSLLVLIKCEENEYKGYVLSTDYEINRFLDAFGMSPTETNRLVDNKFLNPEIEEKREMYSFISQLNVEFPNSELMSITARDIQNHIYNRVSDIIKNPDAKLVSWIEMEYKLFRTLEYERYGNLISHGFETVEEFINLANQVLNRRKSRAGKSLENHLAALFDGNHLQYEAQVITEGNKKPDFLFPSKDAYRDFYFPVEKLVSLAAKTTCKDRWRQVLNEADRLRTREKFLCTLQQGISLTQMDEMQAEKVILVVPQAFINCYPQEARDRIWSVSKFISYIKEIENI